MDQWDSKVENNGWPQGTDKPAYICKRFSHTNKFIANAGRRKILVGHTKQSTSLF